MVGYTPWRGRVRMELIKKRSSGFWVCCDWDVTNLTFKSCLLVASDGIQYKITSSPASTKLSDCTCWNWCLPLNPPVYWTLYYYLSFTTDISRFNTFKPLSIWFLLSKDRQSLTMVLCLYSVCISYLSQIFHSHRIYFNWFRSKYVFRDLFVHQKITSFNIYLLNWLWSNLSKCLIQFDPVTVNLNQKCTGDWKVSNSSVVKKQVVKVGSLLYYDDVNHHISAFKAKCYII